MIQAPCKASLSIKDKSPDKRDQAVFKWAKGAAVSRTALGNPLTNTDYTLCVYDESGGAPRQILRLTAPARSRCRGLRPCWRGNESGFKFTDPDTSRGWLQSIQIKAGGAGKAKVLVKAKGGNLLPSSLPLKQQSKVTARLVGSNGPCFDAEFSAPAKKSDSENFKDKAD